MPDLLVYSTEKPPDVGLIQPHVVARASTEKSSEPGLGSMAVEASPKYGSKADESFSRLAPSLIVAGACIIGSNSGGRSQPALRGYNC